MKTKLIVLLLGLLGFSACNNQDMYGTPEPPMYAPPPPLELRLNVSGKVTDAEGTPIKGISVMSDAGQTINTTADGSYYITQTNENSDLSGQNMNLTFTDIDGPDNGGEFATKSVKNMLTEADRVSDNEYTKTLDVTLEEKK